MKKRKVETFENMLGEYVTSDGIIDAVGKTEKESKKKYQELKSTLNKRG